VASFDKTIDVLSGGLLKGDEIFFAYQAAKDFTLAGTIIINGINLT